MDLEKAAELFKRDHLPVELQKISKSFHDLAVIIITDSRPSAETTLAVRKLWEVKNLVVYVHSSSGE